MGFFSRRKQPVVEAPPLPRPEPSAAAPSAVEPSARELRKQAKKEEKARARAAKRAMKELKQAAAKARKQRRREERAMRRQRQTLRRLQKRIGKDHKRLVRQRKKAAKRLRQQEERAAQEQRDAEAAATARAATTELRRSVSQAVAAGDATAVTLTPPKFQELAHCSSCHVKFHRLSLTTRHHCRNCGGSFCGKCLSAVKRPIPWFKMAKPQKVCYACDVTVFNGMGGASRSRSRAATASTASSASTSSLMPLERMPNDVRSASQSSLPVSESPEMDVPVDASRRRPRSRRAQTSSSSSKKTSRWALPIRPLLRRKSSADRLRNRSLDLEIQLEKTEMLARQRHAQTLVAPSRSLQVAQFP
ncbi:hypothetical protein P43SY_007428 [Pythium insidiosum]|uniref:FYVE-type domain-containing protein n=1 Tax=Pythium insidiosum TaxID=114742 RepID=A0AAD5LEY5_PYTIN|nr:hypothetical protein P43SY_007428 [Pythium insidiosum]